ncbi:xanthine dehydrogenase, molybdenum binding subunit apoprotein [Desulfonatronum zhilinae]|nr:xanthine dehydrogenase, molybdenum binding subunit apoprotein [Desulfonatronum zhilinae]
MSFNHLAPAPQLEIGRSVPRIDGLAKACGTERYAVDEYPPNLLWAGARRAGVPHARIRSVDISRAESLPGIIRILTRQDVPGTNRQGILHKDQPVLAGTKVRHCGDPVALVLAETKSALAEALAAIGVDLEPLPAVFDPEPALRKGAPLVHDGRDEGNLLVGSSIITGRGKAALADCPVRVRGGYAVPAQRHAYLEPENGVAWQDEEGILHMVVSTQAPFRDRFEIGYALGLDPTRIRVVAPYLGGGFGGKDGATVQCLLVLAAMHAKGRPVKMCWDREESFLAGYTRHAARMNYELGADKDGTLLALHCRLLLDTGAYAHLGGEVLALGLEHAAGPYRVPNVQIEGRAAYTNNPVAGAMRGFGVAQVSFGMERIMDRLANRLGMDPLDLRRKNALNRGDRNACGVTVTGSTGIRDCLDKVAEHSLWRERETWVAQAPRFKRRGVGLAAVHNAMGYGRGLPDSAIAKVELTPEGMFRIFSGVADMGQGNATAYAQIAGQILGQDASRLEMVQPDTSRCHPSGSSSAGRTTYTFGKALIPACEDLKAKLLARAAMFFFLEEPRDLALLPGLIRHLPTGRDLPLTRLGAFFSQADRQAVAEAFMPVAPDAVSGGREFRIGFPHLLFAHAAHAAFVEVDELTGAVEVCRYLAVTEAGRVLNPQAFEQQVHGAVAQGLGYALSEDMHIQEGRVLADTLTTYIIPTALDVPDMVSPACDVEEPSGPFGMKGVGEVGMNGPLPAVANAAHAACGADVCQAPLTPERVLKAMKRRKK